MTDPDVLARIRALAVPPAWTNVWISADDRTHIQATGRDAKGRKQYRYHPMYRRHRDEAKFDQLVPFGQQLGALRRRVESDLDHAGLPHERVTAVVIKLLEETFIRVGNEEYARSNRTFGLTTLRDRHVSVVDGELRIKFRGKASIMHAVHVGDPRLVKLVRRCKDLPGQQLFQWVDADGVQHPLQSADVNAYLRAATGLDATAKTFRTWGGSLLAAAGLAAVDTPDVTAKLRKSAVIRAMEVVSEVLGNTPTVCRRSYVHPVIVDRFLDGELASAWHDGPRRSGSGLVTEERKLLHVLTLAR